jgi:hypothetical protein
MAVGRRHTKNQRFLTPGKQHTQGSLTHIATRRSKIRNQ